MKYEILFFDADDTLFDFKKAESEAFKNTMLEFNLPYEETYHLPLYQKINSTLWKEFEQGLISQEKLKVERFKRLTAQLALLFDEMQFAKAYMKNLANASFLFEKSMELIKELHASYRLSIITNGLKDVQNKRIRQSPLAAYFEDIVISEEVKVAKPDPKIFEYAMQNINYRDKSKVLLVGDSLSSDIKGGVQFGIDTCWYNPYNLGNNSNLLPTYQISKLTDLPLLLRS